MATSTTRKTFRQKVLARLYRGRYPHASTTTSGGTATTLIDTALGAGAVDNDYYRAWIYIVEATGGGAAAYGDIGRVVSQSGNTLTLSSGFTGTGPASGCDYEVHYIFHPNLMNDVLDEVLESIEYPIMVPYGLNTNPGFETWTSTSAATGWTLSDAVNDTLARESTVVRFGRYSAKVTYQAGGTYLYSSTVSVTPGDNVYAAANVFVTSLDSAVLQVYDKSNSAVLESGRADGTGWSEIAFTASIPSGCEQIELRLVSVNAGDVLYWSNANVHVIGDKELVFPGEAEWSFDLRNTFYFPKGKAITPATTSEYNYAATAAAPQFWSHGQLLRDETGVNPYRFYPEKALATETVWFLVTIDYPAFAGSTVSDKDTDTTKAPMLLAVPMATAKLLDLLAEQYEENGQTERAQVYTHRAERIRQREVEPIRRKFAEFRTKVQGANRG